MADSVDAVRVKADYVMPFKLNYFVGAGSLPFAHAIERALDVFDGSLPSHASGQTCLCLSWQGVSFCEMPVCGQESTRETIREVPFMMLGPS